MELTRDEDRPQYIRWLNTGEVGIRLGLHRQRVDYLLRTEKIQSIRVGRLRRIREDWLLAYQDEQRERQ